MTKLERIRNYFIRTNTDDNTTVEYPYNEARYRLSEDSYFLTSINDASIGEYFKFADLLDGNGLAWTDQATLTAWLQKNTGGQLITNDDSLDVNVQDQHSPVIIAKMSIVDSETTLAVEGAIDDTVLSVTDATSFSAGQYLSLFDINSNRFFVSYILSISVNDITLDTPLDFAYPIGTFVTGGRTDMAVDGSVTPVIFGVRNTDATIGTTADITRIIFTCLTSSAPTYADFGDITGGLTSGIVMRKVDGTTRNIFNLKTNGELQGIMYDLAAADAVNPNQGQNGFVARLTFAGQSKIGVTTRLAPGEDLQLIVQDDLTDLELFEIVVEGHEVV